MARQQGMTEPGRGRRRMATSIGLGLAIGLAIAAEAPAAGSRILPKSDGSPDGLYYPLDSPFSPLSAYITEYASGDFDPGDIIVGARVADYGTDGSEGSQVAAELRFEDPFNPGFPDFSSDGLVAEALAGLESPCGDAAFRREIGFVPVEAPSHRALYLVVRLPEGDPAFPCGIQLDTTSKPLGASKCYLGSTDEFLTIRANHLSEIRILRTGPQDLGLDVHGTARYPGDVGRPVVFARRANPDELLTDDFISLDIVVDNNEPHPVSLLVDVWADVSEIAPNRLPIELTSRFKNLGSTGRLDALRTFNRGRTVIRTELKRSLPRWSLGLLPNRVRIDAYLVDPSVPSVPRDTESAHVGLRPAPGINDDGSTEQILLVSDPVRQGDALAVRYPLIDLPRVPFVVSAIEVIGCTVGGIPGFGYDAVEVRREDPILTGSPDPTAQGVVRTMGAVDGIPDALMSSVLAPERFQIDPIWVDPEDPDLTNLWGQVVLVPGHRLDRGTVVGADLDAESLLLDSFYSESGQLPYRADVGRNYEIRLIIENWESPLEAANPGITAPLGGLPGGYTASGGPRPVSVVVIAGGGHGHFD